MNNQDTNLWGDDPNNAFQEMKGTVNQAFVQDRSTTPRTKRETKGKYQSNRASKHRNAGYKKKWYLSFPIILLSIFVYPVSIALTVLRAKDIKKQVSPYRENTLIAVGLHIVLLLAIITGAVSGAKWENSFEEALSERNYDIAYEMLEEKFAASMDIVGIDYYFRVFDESGNYEKSPYVLEQYYSCLSDKTQLDPAVRMRYQEISSYLSPEEYKRVQAVLEKVDDAIQIKVDEEQSALQKQAEKEEADRIKAEQKSEEQKRLKEEEREKREAEEEKEALTKAEEKRAAQIAKAREAVDNYFEKDSLWNLKKVSQQDRVLVENYLVEIVKEYLVYNPNSAYDARKLQDKIEKVHNLYLDAFSLESSPFFAILSLSQDLVSSYEELEKVESRYPFPISKANSCSWQEFYITQRLEKSYSDNILGTIQKEIDSYTRDNTSNWVAYNVVYLPLIGATAGDNVIVIHSSELNPFSEQGAYKLLCYSDGKTMSLSDSKGFVFEAPVVYMISDDNQLCLDSETYQNLNNTINIIKLELSNWRFSADVTQNASDNISETWITAMVSAVRGNTAFVMSESSSIVNILEVTSVHQNHFEQPLMPVQFAVVDMDQDGRNEVIVELTNNFDGWRILLRYWEGNVYGYGFVYRGLQNVSTTGLAISSSGASDSDVFRLRFNGQEMHYEALSATEARNALSSWIDASWYMFTSANIDRLITDESMISEPVVSPTPIETQAPVLEQTTAIEGYVIEGSGGLNIRNGPGTDYAQVGRLAEYAAVSVLETQWADGREWGRIDAGWVCMDYIVPGNPAPVSTNNVLALNFVNATTGSVVNRLGTNIVYTGGFAGSNLFYISNNSNMQFGYVPHDWNNPALVGDEAITIISLSGNAKISSNLSANMTKSELDATAWDTPDVQNVSSESYYSEIFGGSVYQYTIETDSARIIYEWHLDMGDSVNSPASDVSVSPK